MEVGQPTQRDSASHFYERFLFVLRAAPALLPAVTIPFGLLAYFGITDIRFYAGNTVFAVIIITQLAASLLYVLYKWRRRGEGSIFIEAAFSIAFHTLILLFALLVTGFLGAPLLAWFVLLISTDARFGFKGFLASFLALCIGGTAAILTHIGLSVGEQVEVFQRIMGVGLVAFLAARIQSLANRERGALAKTQTDEQYQRERLLALVNSMGDAVIATDDQGRIKLHNSSMLNLLDTNADLTERAADDVLQLRDKDNRPVSILAEAKERRTMFSRNDLQIAIPGDEPMKLYINVAPIQPGYQSHTEHGYIIIARDITKEKTLEEERDEFVSVVSHELRTPVTIAEGNLSNMQIMFNRGAEKAVMVKAVNDAHEQIIYLSKLVNDLSTLAKSERGTGGKPEPIDLHELLVEMHKTYSQQAQAKSLQLNLDVAPTLPIINAIRLYVEEILQNLITNSIKYTQKGSVTIKSHVQEGDIAIDITDTGIGISKSDQDHVFEKFYRSEDYRTRESSGTGLGLYVVKKLAEKQGFKIVMTSRLNYGSTFTLLIPAKSIVATEAKSASSTTAPVAAATPATSVSAAPANSKPPGQAA